MGEAVSEQKTSQTMSNDDIDDILELVDVVEVGKGVLAPPSGDAEADFAADLDSMLNDLEAKESKDTPFPDPTPVDYEVDPNESLDLPSMDDLDNLLAELGAEKPETSLQPSESDAVGDRLDNESQQVTESQQIDGDENKATITAALDKALSSLDELDSLDDKLTATLVPENHDPVADELDDIFAKALESIETSTGPEADSSPDKAAVQPHQDFETAEMVHPDDIFLDVSEQADDDTFPADEKSGITPDDGIEVSATEKNATPETLDTTGIPGQSNQEGIPPVTGKVEDGPSVSHTERESLPIDIEGLGDAPLTTALPESLAQEQPTQLLSDDTPATVAETTVQSGIESAKSAVSGTRIDEDLNELDALLDDMLSSAPASPAGESEEETMASSPMADELQDELQDVLERLDNLESSTVTEQLFDRCNTLEEQISQKDATINSLQDALAMQKNHLASLEQTMADQQEHITSLKALLSEQKEHMATLDTDMEKMVAAAAARVIREEISALLQSLQDEE